MIQDTIIVKQRHERFVKQICESGIVFGLENEDGFATSSSNQYEDDNEEPIGLVCFWSERALAKSCAKEGWETYKTTELSISEFIENWCVGLYTDGELIGTNFDQNMFGYEIEPLELIIEIVKELRRTNKDIKFSKFDGLNDIEKQVNDILKN